MIDMAYPTRKPPIAWILPGGMFGIRLSIGAGYMQRIAVWIQREREKGEGWEQNFPSIFAVVLSNLVPDNRVYKLLTWDPSVRWVLFCIFAPPSMQIWFLEASFSINFMDGLQSLMVMCATVEACASLFDVNWRRLVANLNQFPGSAKTDPV